MLTIMASGDVSNYADTSSLRQTIATAAGVDASLVTISVKSASVIITATIAVPATTTAAAVQSTVSSNLGTTAAASAALGITVEAVPTIAVQAGSGGGEGVGGGGGGEGEADSGGDSGDSGSNGGGDGGGGGGAIIGGAAGGGGVLLLVVVGIYCMKTRGKSLTTVKVEKGGTPATKGDTATRKAATIYPLPTTYTVELTMTPLGLGLSLTDDVVTEIKPDSQAARNGRIKVGFRRLTLALTLTLTRWVIGSWL